MGRRRDGSFGAFSGSGKLEKGSLSAEIQKKLNEEGVAVIPLPHAAVKKEKLDMKVCKQYALQEFAENIVLLDTGYAKIMTPFFDLETLRRSRDLKILDMQIRMRVAREIPSDIYRLRSGTILCGS